MLLTMYGLCVGSQKVPTDDLSDGLFSNKNINNLNVPLKYENIF